MKRRGRPTFTQFAILLAFTVATVLAVGPVSPARADEDDDIQRQVETQKAGVPDLEHLDTLHAATGDIQRLRDWLALAWDLRNKHEPDEARSVLDRCLAQGELVRQIIATSQLKAEVAAKEIKLQKTRDEIERSKKALLEVQAKKRALDLAVPQ